jgi:hypothetical protein
MMEFGIKSEDGQTKVVLGLSEGEVQHLLSGGAISAPRSDVLIVYGKSETDILQQMVDEDVMPQEVLDKAKEAMKDPEASFVFEGTMAELRELDDETSSS